MTDLNETGDKAAASTDAVILNRAADRAAIARAQRRFKAQLELTFEGPAKVYIFFGFSEAKLTKPKAKASRSPVRVSTA